MIEQDLVVALKTLIPNVYPLMMPEDVVFPCITYFVVHDGQNQATNGNFSSRNVRFQVDIFSKSYAEVKSLKESVVTEVIGLKGGSISAQDLYENEIKLYRELIDFSIKRT